MGTEIRIDVHVTGAPAGLLERKKSKLPDVELINGDAWDTGMEYDPEARGFKLVETTYTYGGTGSSSDADVIYAWAKKFTTKHADCTVMVSEEWNEGEPGQEQNVFRAGELVRAESKVNMMVNMDLGTAVREGQDALALIDAGDYDYDRAIEALRALLKGLS